MKVAIAFIDEGSYCEDVGQIMLHRHVTEWKEVDETEFQYLKQGVAMHNSRNYNGTKMYLITLPTEQGSVVFDTIEEGKKYFKSLEEARRKYEEEMKIKQEAVKKKREESKKKKELSLDEKKKLLKSLQKEVEEAEKTKKDEKVK